MENETANKALDVIVAISNERDDWQARCIAAEVALEVARRDAERWRWAKEHPRIAVNIFYVEWREQRDFDSAIDTEMQQEAIESTTCDMSPKTASVRKEEGGIK